MTKTGLYLIVSPAIGLIPSSMLINVTNTLKNTQLLSLTCFIIHVGLECIGEKAYA